MKQLASIIVRLQHCITDINHWVSTSRLIKLNISKTGLLWAGTRQCLWLRMAVFHLCILLHTLFIQVSVSERLQLSSRPTSVSQSWETCYQRQRELLLPSSATSTHPACTQYGVCCDAGARLCDVPGRLVQRRFRRGSKDNHQRAQSMRACWWRIFWTARAVML